MQVNRSPFDGIPPGPKDWIAVKNGILCLDRLLEGQELNKVLLPHNLDWWSTVRLSYPFDPAAKCPRWLAFLERSLEGDQERINLLQEWAGYLLLPHTDMQKFLVLEGEGGNGKSVFLAGMQAMLGSDQVSNVQLEIFGQRFALTNTLGKLANICADVGEIDKVCEGYLKSYTSGDTMFFDRKGIPGINARPTARLMISVNNRPRFSDRSSGVWRRMLLCPWRVQINAAERVRGMDNHQWWEMQGETSGMLNWAIAGLARLREQDDFTDPKICREALENYRTESNPAREFLLDRYEQHPEGREECEAVYKSYRDWCNQSGYKPLAKNTFGREVFRIFTEAKRIRARVNNGLLGYTYAGITEKIADDF